jgi:hypothetical protein
MRLRVHHDTGQVPDRTMARPRENFDISPLPEDAFEEIHRIQIRQRFNDVVHSGSPDFIPRSQ